LKLMFVRFTRRWRSFPEMCYRFWRSRYTPRWLETFCVKAWWPDCTSSQRRSVFSSQIIAIISLAELYYVDTLW